MFKRLIVGLISVTLLFQSLVFSSPVYASPVITTENYQAVYEIPFSNSIEFYQELDKALKSNEPIVIKTDFKSYEEFPKDLKKIVKVDPSNSSIGTGGVIGALPRAHLAIPAAGAVGQLPNLMMPALLDEKALDCVTITGIGAAIGGFVGGPFGALVGGGLAGGACIIKDTVDKAFQSPDHVTMVGCGPSGCTITIQPTNSSNRWS